MTRSILFPLLALSGIVLYGTTRASQPATEIEAYPVMSSDRIDISPERSAARGPAPTATRPAAPTPPPAPRLRSEVEAEEEAAPPPPAPEDSVTVEAAVEAGTTIRLTPEMTRTFVRYDAEGRPIGEATGEGN